MTTTRRTRFVIEETLTMIEKPDDVNDVIVQASR